MNSIRRFLAVLVALCALLPATSRSATYSDMWWVPSESGWGATVVEQADIMFVLLYIYGPDGKPSWFVAPLMRYDTTITSAVVFSGDLYATTGPSFAGTFNPNQTTNRVVGSIVFRGETTIQASLTYTVDGVQVTKTIQRFTFRLQSPDGSYHGAVVKLPQSNCQGSAIATSNPIPTVFTITINASPGGAGPYTFIMNFLDGAVLQGRYEQFGALVDILGTFTLAGSTFDANLLDVTLDDDGFRGKILARSRTTGCLLYLRVGGVRANANP